MNSRSSRSRSSVAAMEQQKIEATATPQKSAASPPGAPANKENDDLTTKFNLIQRQLALILHAQRCPLPLDACLLPNCTTMKQVLAHIPNCEQTSSNPKCPFQYCFSSRHIIGHWSQCGGNRDNILKCEVCDPVRRLMCKRPAEAPSSGLDVPNTTVKRQRIQNFDVLVWCAVVEWGKSTAGADEGGWAAPKGYTKISLPCQVFAHTTAAAAELIASTSAPTRLQMKLIPSSVLQKLGLMANVRPLRFEFSSHGGGAVGASTAVADLIGAMKGGQYVGYVHMDCGGVSKILVLHYDKTSGSEAQGKFMGYMPTDQKSFVDKLRKVVEEQRERGKQAAGGGTADGPTIEKPQK